MPIAISTIAPTSFNQSGGALGMTGTFPAALDPFDVYLEDGLNLPIQIGTGVSATGETNLDVTVPPATASGTYNVSVLSVPSPGDFAYAPDPIVISAAPDSVTSGDPLTFASGTGGTITITGVFSGTDYYIRLDDPATTEVGPVNPTGGNTLTFTIPDGIADGTYTLLVWRFPGDETHLSVTLTLTMGNGIGGAVASADQLVIIRDSNLVGAVVSADSEDAPRTGLTIPDTANQGSLSPVVMGDPDADTIANIELQIVQGGAIGSAGWAWKDADAGTWHGAHGEAYAWGHHACASANHLGAVVVYSRVFRRVLVISAAYTASPLAATGTIQVSWQDLNDRPMAAATWEAGGNSTTFVPSGGVSSGTHPLAACELGDGAILLAVKKAPAGSSSDALSAGDLDLYRSEDGGSTWTLVREDVLQAAGASGCSESGCARIAASGNWIRLAFVEYLSGSIASVVSADGGATWQTLTALVAGSVVAAPLSDQANDTRPFDLVAVDDNTGAFLLVSDPNATGATNRVKLWYATRDGEWSGIAAINTTSIPDTPRAYAFYRDPYFLWLWIACADPGSATDCWTVLRCPRELVLTGSEWLTMSNPLRMRGATRLYPMQVRAVWCDDRAAMIGYLEDGEAGGVAARKENRPWLCWIGGWSQRPWGIDTDRADGLLESVHWVAPMGEPALGPTSSTQSSWVHALVGSGTHSWRNTVDVLYSGATSGEYSYSQIEIEAGDQADPPQWDPALADEQQYQITRLFACEWVCAMGTTGSSLANNAGVRVWSPSISGAAGTSFRLVVRIGTTNANVVDENASTVLATLAPITPTTLATDIWHRFRLVVAPAATASGDPQGILQYRRDDGDLWVETSVFSIPAPAGAGVTMTRLAHGLLGNSSGGYEEVAFREFRASSYWFRPNYTDWTSPGDLPGARAAVRPRGLSAGSTAGNPQQLRAYWGGGGGMIGDNWTHEVDHEYSAERIALDSPQFVWRSASGATAGSGIVWDACHGAAVDDGRRWVHSHAALYGMSGRRALLEYADDAAITSNVVALTMDGQQHTGLRAAAVAGSVIRIDPLSEPADPWREGELAGRMLVVTTGASTAGHVHWIDRHFYDGTSHHVVLATGSQFAPSLIAAGATMSIVSDRVWGSLGQTVTKRYMRLKFGITGDNNWSGRWQCSAFVPGIARAFDPPLSWSHTDEEEPNTVVQRARNGQTWAYEEGPAGRLWVGRQVGDTTGDRDAFRDLLRVLARYQQEPIAVLLNDEATEDQDRRLLYTRFEGGTRLDQQAWHRTLGTGTRNRPVGDVQVQFREIV